MSLESLQNMLLNPDKLLQRINRLSIEDKHSAVLKDQNKMLVDVEETLEKKFEQQSHKLENDDFGEIYGFNDVGFLELKINWNILILCLIKKFHD